MTQPQIRRWSGPGPARPVGTSATGDPGGRARVARFLAVVGACGLVGALAGLVWQWLWTPPTGTVVDGGWQPDPLAVAADFAGTGWFVVVGAVTGAVLGLLTARTTRRGELTALVALGVGAVVATYLMWRVGTLAGPPDPVEVLRAGGRGLEGEVLPDDLRVRGSGAFLALPAGALLGATVGFLGGRREPARESVGKTTHR